MDIFSFRSGSKSSIFFNSETEREEAEIEGTEEVEVDKSLFAKRSQGVYDTHASQDIRR